MLAGGDRGSVFWLGQYVVDTIAFQRQHLKYPAHAPNAVAHFHQMPRFFPQTGRPRVITTTALTRQIVNIQARLEFLHRYPGMTCITPCGL